MKRIAESELIINGDGSVFHLHILPKDLARTVILVGDQNRVPAVAQYFDAGSIVCDKASREFHTITGKYHGKRITCMSTGIGTDNIDIVLNELDALANIDFNTRNELPEHRTLNIVRIGTCGALQDDITIGSYIASEYSIGLDGVLAYYAGRDEASDLALEQAFVDFVCLPAKAPRPYAAKNNTELLERIAKNDMIRGITISANGFYGPQGRQLRGKLADPDINKRLNAFRFGEHRVCNYEMEGSAIAVLGAIMGHKALTVCCVIAQRRAEQANTDYKPAVNRLITTVLDRI